MNIVHYLPLLVGSPEMAGGGGATSITPTLVTFALVFAIFYFLIIRPQNKKQKETQEMLNALKKGDRVVTIGGIRGTIFSLKEDAVVLKLDDNVKIQFSRSAIAHIQGRGGSSTSNATSSESTEEIKTEEKQEKE